MVERTANLGERGGRAAKGVVALAAVCAAVCWSTPALAQDAAAEAGRPEAWRLEAWRLEAWRLEAWLTDALGAWGALDLTARLAALAALAWVAVAVFGIASRRLGAASKQTAPRDVDAAPPIDTAQSDGAGASQDASTSGLIDHEALQATDTLLIDPAARREKALRRGARLVEGSTHGASLQPPAQLRSERSHALSDEPVSARNAAQDLARARRSLRQAEAELGRRIRAIAARETAARKRRERAE